ncbi:hypothetical protein SteCoe_36486 [Stentor coeruleus]|uniref:Uncharacterized protein n=1 Tax=Stentor coeruleus TaxID=5963 RepID=A0A1R2AQ29_9CILI|nr:hypothetical protein SteCoe_36486 [Stentor coeruleus]
MENCSLGNRDIESYNFPLKQLIERIEEVLFELKTNKYSEKFITSKLRFLFRLCIVLQELVKSPHIKSSNQIKQLADYLECQLEFNLSSEINDLILIILCIILDKHEISNLLINHKNYASYKEFLNLIVTRITKEENHDNVQIIAKRHCYSMRSIEEVPAYSSKDPTEISSNISI